MVWVPVWLPNGTRHDGTRARPVDAATTGEPFTTPGTIENQLVLLGNAVPLSWRTLVSAGAVEAMLSQMSASPSGPTANTVNESPRIPPVMLRSLFGRPLESNAKAPWPGSNSHRCPVLALLSLIDA